MNERVAARGERWWSRFTVAGEGHPLVALGSVVTCGVFALLLAGIVIDPIVVTKYGQALTLLTAGLALLALLGLTLSLARLAELLESRPWWRRGLGLGLLAAYAVVLARIGFAMHFPSTFDAQVIEEGTWGLANNLITRDKFMWYVEMYPNNALLSATLRHWYAAAAGLHITSMAVPAVLLNTVALTFSVAMASSVARQVAGPRAAYVVGVLVATLLLLTPWIGVAYSDTLGMPFPILIVWCFVVARATSRTWLRVVAWGGLGLATSLGMQIKPTVIFAALAAVLVTALTARLRRPTRADAVAAIAAAACVLGYVAAGAAGDAVVRSADLMPSDEAKAGAMPWTHFLGMGAQERDGRYGAFVLEDVQDTMAIPPGPERDSHGIKVYRERVAAMGPVGYASFLRKKAEWTFGDGSFAAYVEGSMSAVNPRSFERHDPLSRRIQSVMSYNGPHYPLLVQWWQSWWLAVLVLVAAPVLWWRRGLHGPDLAMMRAAVLGLLVFLLLFEARARYIYLYLPLFFVLAAATASTLVVALADRRSTRMTLTTPGRASM